MPARRPPGRAERQVPVRVSTQHGVTERVRAHGADAQLPRVPVPHVFDHDQEGIDDDYRQDPRRQHRHLVWDDEQQDEEHERQHDQQGQPGADQPRITPEEPFRATADHLAQLFGVRELVQDRREAHRLVDHRVVLGHHQVGLGQPPVEQRVQVQRVPAHDQPDEQRDGQVQEQMQHVDPVMVAVESRYRATHRVDAVRERQPRVQLPEEVRHHLNRVQARRARNLDDHQYHGDRLADMPERDRERIDDVDVHERAEQTGEDEQHRMLALDAEHQIADHDDQGLEESDDHEQQPPPEIRLRRGHVAEPLAVDL